MLNHNWKSTALLAAISVATVVLLVTAAIGMFYLPFFTGTGMISWLVLLLLTLAASRFTVSVTSTDGVRRSRKSIADAFVFLAVMIYATSPANTVGPAVLLAAIVGFVSTYRLTNRREIIFTTGMAVISTFVAASFYSLLVGMFAGHFNLTADPSLPVNALLVPLFTLAALQYALNTITTAWFLSFDAGKLKLIPSADTVVWTLTTQLAGAASAV